MKPGFYSLLVGLMIFILLPGCSPKIEKILVATDATWPPWEYVDNQTGPIKGFDIDLFNAIAEKENLQVEFIDVDLSQLLTGITQCQYDVAISSLSITEERKKDMFFSDPYLEAGQQVAVKIDNNDITDKAALKGKVVGVQSGSAGALEVEQIEGATLKTYDNIRPAFQDLVGGLIDAVITDRIVCSWYVRKNHDALKTVDNVFTTEFGGIAICKTKPRLLKKINSGLKAVREEGLIDNLIDKWFITP
jgi:polar amino acid transport system substrate-binding protein